MPGERIMVKRWEAAPENHRLRYEWAAAVIAAIGAASHPVMNVLDIGCGCGYGTRYMAAQLGGLVIGCDISPGAFSYAAKHHSGEAAFYTCAIPPATFGAIVCLETLEHVQDDAGFLGELASHMDSDSILLISTPNGYYAPCEPEHYPFHIRHYTPAVLECRLSMSGLRVIDWARQMGSEPGTCDVLPGSPDGLCILAVCKKQGGSASA